jgi:hypothetical protein
MDQPSIMSISMLKMTNYKRDISRRVIGRGNYPSTGRCRKTRPSRGYLDGPDFFPTPAWATFALVDNGPFQGEIWECACGNGAMSRVLEPVCMPGSKPVKLLHKKAESPTMLADPGKRSSLTYLTPRFT